MFPETLPENWMLKKGIFPGSDVEVLNFKKFLSLVQTMVLPVETNSNLMLNLFFSNKSPYLRPPTNKSPLQWSNSKGLKRGNML